MTTPKQQPDEPARRLFDAVKLIADGFEHIPTETLSQVHAMVSDYFLEVTEPHGRTDNIVQQRLVGAMWAEIEEVLDSRTKRKG